LPATQTVASSTETVIVDPQNTSAALIVSVPPNRFEQIPFDLVISGYLKTTSSTNLTLKVYSGTSTTVGSNTKIADSSTVAQNSASAPFEVRLHLLYDTVSGKLTGFSEFLINNTLVAKTALAAVVTGLNNVNNPVANFVFSLTSSGADGTHLTTINVANFTLG